MNRHPLFAYLTASSPDDALRAGIDLLQKEGVVNESRNGAVLQMRAPVVTIYPNPRSRVSFCPIRDANPFFHLFESIWMLAGKNDVASVSRFASQMSAFSDDGETLHGAYGYRWRHFFDFDQLEVIIDLLRRDPKTRRAVLTMWAPYGDLIAAEGADGGITAKDVPCNTQVYFDATCGKLNMTVTNRSNDIVWGAYGANVVHMSYLHEFVATLTGLPLGTYYQFSNNYHAYVDRPDVQKLFANWFRLAGTLQNLDHECSPLYFMGGAAAKLSTVTEELRAFAEGDFDRPYETALLATTAKPMMKLFLRHKAGDTVQAAREAYMKISDPAWRAAASGWLARRAAKLQQTKETR